MAGGLQALRLLRPAASPALLPAASFASEVRPRDLNTAAMKRGRGGRSSFSGDTVTVFGSNGFIGTAVANRLGKNGSQMILPYRGEHYKMMRLKPAGDLGQILFCPIELKDEDSIRRAVAHSNIVINCIGRGVETSNFSYEDVNITGPATIARLCKEAGVKRLVHMSHLNARAKPEQAWLPGGSRWLATKYQGELAVRAEFPEATIFRPSDVYGQGDNFILYWFSNIRNFRRKGVALYGKGELTVKNPIFRSDLVDGIMASLYDPAAVGQTYEAVGPHRMTQAELMTYMHGLTSRYEDEDTFWIKELLLEPKTLLRTAIAEKLPFGAINSFHQTCLDRLERDSISDTTDGLPQITDLGVKLHSVEEKMPWELSPFDLYGYYFYENPEDKRQPRLPHRLTMVEDRQLDQTRSQGKLAIASTSLPPFVKQLGII